MKPRELAGPVDDLILAAGPVLDPGAAGPCSSCKAGAPCLDLIAGGSRVLGPMMKVELDLRFGLCRRCALDLAEALNRLASEDAARACK